MKNKWIFLIVILSLVLFSFSCKDNKNEKSKILVSYYIDEQLVYEETLENENMIDSSKVRIPDGYININWEKAIYKENNGLHYVFTLSYSIKQCTITLNVEGYDEEIYSVGYGEKFELPNYTTPKGYYLEWSQDLSVLDNVIDDISISGVRIECDKQTLFYIDGVLVKDETTKYSIVPSDPEIPENVKTYRWIKSETYENNKYIVTMVLEYTLKGGKIRYFDGSEELFLDPSSYLTGDTFDLPDYKKDGYEFIGWFASEISMYRYTSIPKNSEDNIILYARFIQTSNLAPFELPNASYHFIGINKIPTGNSYVYQPQLPTSAPATSALEYEWSTSDQAILGISAYASMTGRKPGYCVVTAIYKANPAIVINAVVKVTSEGIVLSSVEEANEIEFCKVTFVDKNNEPIYEQLVPKGGNIIPPTPAIYDGLAFVGWDHEVYGIQENTIIKPKYVEGNNPYVGKKIAIIGDSISTFYGYIPEGYSYFYPYPTADLYDYNQTWWMQVINNLGGGLFVNNSYSGSCVSTGTSGTNTDSRLSSTIINKECPDVIIIYMGSNDCASKFVGIRDFRNEYKVMLDKLQKLCPNSEIILCTLAISKLYTVENQIEYNEVIRNYANNYNLKLIDLEKTDISNDLVDSAHPNRNGHNIFAKKVMELILEEKH